jgi:hypothetical protein
VCLEREEESLLEFVDGDWGDNEMMNKGISLIHVTTEKGAMV